ncbi:MAG: putative metal-dependent protease of the PAD1/JAB1 superfamily [Haloquadratum sp. J07HQX50]|jgi:proteasome Rpn11 subunit JAMM motif . Metallo peptidase. MEROPS family M67B|nr:MAG: putative metal-dependent protease of the PAD1/JAB1 superfamily [Haloquadratum sp. J07HQX50]
MGLFGSTTVTGIAADAIEFAQSAAAETHPDEYMGLLRAESAKAVGLDRSGLLITEVMVVPGTTSSSTSATLNRSMVPNDMRTVGSIHSHPNGVLQPSDTDRNSFRSGSVHIIMGYPYERGDWAAFDPDGSERRLEVFEADLPDPESFFDFSEDDLDVPPAEDDYPSSGDIHQ